MASRNVLSQKSFKKQTECICRLEPVGEGEFDFFPASFLLYVSFLILLCVLVIIVEILNILVNNKSIASVFDISNAFNSYHKYDISSLNRINLSHESNITALIMYILNYILIYGVCLSAIWESLFSFYRYYTTYQTTKSLQLLRTIQVIKRYSIYGIIFAILFIIEIHLYYFVFPLIILYHFIFNYYCNYKFSSMLVEEYSIISGLDPHNIMHLTVLRSVYFIKRASMISYILQSLCLTLFLITHNVEIIYYLPILWCLSTAIFTLNFIRNRHYVYAKYIQIKHTLCPCAIKTVHPSLNHPNNRVNTINNRNRNTISMHVHQQLNDIEAQNAPDPTTSGGAGAGSNISSPTTSIAAAGESITIQRRKALELLGVTSSAGSYKKPLKSKSKSKAKSYSNLRHILRGNLKHSNALRLNQVTYSENMLRAKFADAVNDNAFDHDISPVSPETRKLRWSTINQKGKFAPESLSNPIMAENPNQNKKKSKSLKFTTQSLQVFGGKKSKNKNASSSAFSLKSFTTPKSISTEFRHHLSVPASLLPKSGNSSSTSSSNSSPTNSQTMQINDEPKHLTFDITSTNVTNDDSKYNKMDDNDNDDIRNTRTSFNFNNDELIMRDIQTDKQQQQQASESIQMIDIQTSTHTSQQFGQSPVKIKNAYLYASVNSLNALAKYGFVSRSNVNSVFQLKRYRDSVAMSIPPDVLTKALTDEPNTKNTKTRSHKIAKSATTIIYGGSAKGNKLL